MTVGVQEIMNMEKTERPVCVAHTQRLMVEPCGYRYEEEEDRALLSAQIHRGLWGLSLLPHHHSPRDVSHPPLTF